MAHELREGTVLISDDAGLLDLDVIHTFLTTSYWSPGIPRNVVERGIRNSMPFGVYDTSETRTDGSARPEQIGFARMITDRATYAYLADVFIIEAYRGRGLSKRLMEVILAHPELQGLRRLCLMTKDAQGLYAQFGFKVGETPDRYMERVDRTVYTRSAGRQP